MNRKKSETKSKRTWIKIEPSKSSVVARAASSQEQALQLRPPQPPPPSLPLPLLSQSFEDLFLLNNPNEQHSYSSEEEDDDDDKTPLSKEESKLEKDIIRLILAGNSQTLKPNSGQAVSIGDHHICVAYHEEPGSDYRVWEWHGHIMLFDLENGYSPEYIYGNYFERLLERAPPPPAAAAAVGVKKEREEKMGTWASGS
ncbi:hypothetical protein Sjap_001719 [Stephania japonica]|uniref:Uncharacterized protein n=1 Tax=Stephania japonica TaxID=461633 RepID=A0AAP0PTS8_9MAGN